MTSYNFYFANCTHEVDSAKTMSFVLARQISKHLKHGSSTMMLRTVFVNQKVGRVTGSVECTVRFSFSSGLVLGQ